MEAIYGGDDAIIESFRPFMLADRGSAAYCWDVPLRSLAGAFGTPELELLRREVPESWSPHQLLVAGFLMLRAVESGRYFAAL